jgi:hypothetical protein
MDKRCGTNGEKKNAWRIKIGKPGGETPLGRRGWKDNIMTCKRVAMLRP